MGALHKRNGGYIGADYRKPYPSGVHVVGGVGRVSESTIDVELYGGAGGLAFGSVGAGGSGGYTKIRLKLDTTKTLEIRPDYVGGGGSAFGWSGGGGSGAGIAINSEWLAVAGGGGGAGGRYVYTVSTNNTDRYANNGGSGSGGYSGTTPSAGGGGSGCGVYADTSPPNYTGGAGTGGGGGGAPGGSNGGSGGCTGNYWNPGPFGGGAGGNGNIRIYYEQSATSGNLNVLPGIYMEYLTHSNGSHSGAPQVKITNVATSASYTYTASKDIKAVYLATGEFNP